MLHQLEVALLVTLDERLQVDQRLGELDADLGHAVCSHLHVRRVEVLNKVVFGEHARALPAQREECASYLEGARLAKFLVDLAGELRLPLCIVLMRQDMYQALADGGPLLLVARLDVAQQGRRKAVLQLGQVEKLEAVRELLQKVGVLPPKADLFVHVFVKEKQLLE